MEWLAPSQLLVRILLGTLYSFMIWGSYPATFRSIGGSTSKGGWSMCWCDIKPNKKKWLKKQWSYSLGRGGASNTTECWRKFLCLCQVFYCFLYSVKTQTIEKCDKHFFCFILPLLINLKWNHIRIERNFQG